MANLVVRQRTVRWSLCEGQLEGWLAVALMGALLVPAGDAAALALAIRRLLDDRALAQRLADAALAAVPKYSWATRAKRLESVFKAIPST